METLLLICRFGHFTAVMVLAGAGVLIPMLTGRSAPPPFWRRGRLWLAVTAGASALAWLMALSALLAGDWHEAFDPATLGAVLGQTEFGHLWIARLALMALLILVLLVWPRHALLATALALVLLASLALTGHAVREDGFLGLLHVVNQMAHLLAAGLWIGGLAVLLGLVLGWEADRDGLDAGLRRFSGIGYGTVALILGTGLVNLRFVIDKPTSFWNTSYGNVLLVKIALVLGMIALALTNRFVLTPLLVAMPALARRRLLWSVGAELILGLAVLAVVSLLGTMAPPSDGMG